MSENQLAVHTPVKASDQLASFLGIDKGMMLETLKAQCFKGKRPDEVSDTQLAAFVSTANVLQVNPLVPGMLYAYPERNGGITPILGPDGVFKKLDEFIASGKLSGFDCEVFMGTDGKPERAEAMIYRAEGQRPAKYTAYFSEWSVTSNPNWQARPRHMLWTRAIKQAARQVIHGLPMDADEYEIAQMHNVTDTATEEAPAKDRPAPPARAKKGAAAVRENTRSASAEIVVEQEPTSPPPDATNPEVGNPVADSPVAPVPTPDPDNGTGSVIIPVAKPVTKGTLSEGEFYDAVCKVGSVSPFIAVVDGVRTGSVQVNVTGQFFGTVFHVGGAVILSEAQKDSDGKEIKPAVVTPIEMWKAGSEVKLRLKGEMRGSKLRTLVVSVETVQEEF